MRRAQPTDALRTGRRAIEGIEGITLIEDWTYSVPYDRWYVKVRIASRASVEGFPDQTEWYFVVSPDYPAGSLQVFPAKSGGVESTFPHQRLNRLGDVQVPWRTGNICAPVDSGYVTRQLGRSEPWSADERLRWYVEGTLAWVRAGATGALAQGGDRFEIPDFAGACLENIRVAFREDRLSFDHWSESDKTHGLFEYVELNRWPGTVFITQIRLGTRGEPFDVGWPSSLISERERKIGGWIRLPGIPIIAPWQPPLTWGEFRVACEGMDLSPSLLELLRLAIQPLRDRNGRLFLIGFPIPQRNGGESMQLHWQALILPILARGMQAAPGFRAGPDSHWRLDRAFGLADSVPIDWLRSENWHQNEITARGRFETALCDQRVAVIGAGALGSAICELLARGGVKKLSIVDDERVEIGNLVRHTLTLDELDQSKAVGVARRIQAISPNLAVAALTGEFSSKESDLGAAIGAHDIVIDTTASDSVLHVLATPGWERPAAIFSLSVNYGATRLYFFATSKIRFPVSDFLAQLQPKIAEDEECWHGTEEIWEGTGCWHPVWPARADDVWLLASGAVKRIESFTSEPPDQDVFGVLEQFQGDYGFSRLEWT